MLVCARLKCEFVRKRNKLFGERNLGRAKQLKNGKDNTSAHFKRFKTILNDLNKISRKECLIEKSGNANPNDRNLSKQLKVMFAVRLFNSLTTQCACLLCVCSYRLKVISN